MPWSHNELNFLYYCSPTKNKSNILASQFELQLMHCIFERFFQTSQKPGIFMLDVRISQLILEILPESEYYYP